MTDLTKFKDLFDHCHIQYTQETLARGYINLTCKQGDRGVKGYIGFETTFDFDPEGNFLEMGAYE